MISPEREEIITLGDTVTIATWGARRWGWLRLGNSPQFQISW